MTLGEKLTKKNMDALIKIDQEVLQEYGILFSSENWDESNFLVDLPGKWELSCTAILNNQCIGFCICSIFDRDKCFVYRVAVSKEYKKKNIGKEMFKFLCKNCISKGINHIVLEVNKDNKPALRFYHKLKFKKVKKEELIQYLQKKGKYQISHINGNYFVESGYPEKKFVLKKAISEID